MTSVDLDAIEARLAAATPGPWEADAMEGYIVAPSGDVATVTRWSDADADLIAHAPEDLAALLAELRATTADLAVAVEVARERGEEVERLSRRLGMTRDNAADDLAELRDENARLLAVAEAAQDALPRVLWEPARDRLRAALDAWRAGGEG